MAPSGSAILVLRALGLGDLLTAVPALRALRRGHPEGVLTLAAPPWLAPLASLTGAVDRLLPVSDMAELSRLHPAPALAVNLHGRGPQSIAAVLRTGARDVLTHRHPDFPALSGPDWRSDLHEVQRWCRLVSTSALVADPADLRLAVPGVPPSANGAVVVHPGASAPSRQWPVERYAAVAQRLHRSGREVVVTGSQAESSLCSALIRQAGLPATADLSGRLDLAELSALVAASALVVCGDTGVAHLASAYATPSVLLFGPTSPKLWGPPTAGPHTVLWRGSSGDPHAATVDPGLLAIGVDEVLAATDLRLAS